MKEETAEYALGLIPLAVKLRNARDDKTGCTLTSGEVVTLIETLQVLKSGPR